MARRAPFFGESVRRLQQALNKSLSMMGHNENVAGFVERTIVNATVPDGLEFGPLITNFLQAQVVQDGEGKSITLPVNVIYREPTDPDTFIKSQRAYREAILFETSQMHTLISGDATASGESRRQALADYLMSLLVTAPAVAAAGRWLLTTALRLAAHLAKQSGRFDGLRVDFTPRLFVGPVPAEEMRLILEMVEGGLFSQEEGMTRLGVDDPDAMKTAISMETETALERKKEITQMLRDLAKIVGVSSGAEFAGATDDERAVLERGAAEIEAQAAEARERMAQQMQGNGEEEETPPPTEAVEGDDAQEEDESA